MESKKGLEKEELLNTKYWVVERRIKEFERGESGTTKKYIDCFRFGLLSPLFFYLFWIMRDKCDRSHMVI